MGITNDPSRPGLPDGMAWNITQGGTGFAPPYALPGSPNATLVQQPLLQPTSAQEAADADPATVIAVPITGGGKHYGFETERATADKYIRSLARGGRLPPPGRVFCSRELEAGLVEHVARQTALFGGLAGGFFPSDEELRAKAREIIGTETTAADDPVLLGKFKDMVREKPALGLGGAPTATAAASGSGSGSGSGSMLSSVGSSGGSREQSQLFQAAPTTTASGDGLVADLPLGLDLDLTAGQMTDILQDMDFQLGDGTGLDDPVLGLGFGA